MTARLRVPALPPTQTELFGRLTQTLANVLMPLLNASTESAKRRPEIAGVWDLSEP